MTGKCRNGGHRDRSSRIPLTGSELMISYGSHWASLVSSGPPCPSSRSFFRSSRGRAAEVDLLVLLDEEVPAPRDFDGVGGGGHGACGAQGGEHQSDGLRELERASEDTRLYLEDSENRV